MDDVRGTVIVTLRGPAERFEAALTAIHQAGITARRDEYEPEKISALFHDGSEDPPQEFVDTCTERARSAAEGTGFTVDRPTVWEGNAASRKLLYNRHTGEPLGAFIDTEYPLETRERILARLAQQHGIEVNDIDPRDPPDWQVPSE